MFIELCLKTVLVDNLILQKSRWNETGLIFLLNLIIKKKDQQEKHLNLFWNKIIDDLEKTTIERTIEAITILIWRIGQVEWKFLQIHY